MCKSVPSSLLQRIWNSRCAESARFSSPPTSTHTQLRFLFHFAASCGLSAWLPGHVLDSIDSRTPCLILSIFPHRPPPTILSLPTSLLHADLPNETAHCITFDDRYP